MLYSVKGVPRAGILFVVRNGMFDVNDVGGHVAAEVKNELEGIELLNDPYLFTKADRILLYETYFDVVDEITDIHENKAELTGWRRRGGSSRGLG